LSRNLRPRRRPGRSSHPHDNRQEEEQHPGGDADRLWRETAERTPEANRYQALDGEGAGGPDEYGQGPVPCRKQHGGQRGLIRDLGGEDHAKGRGEESWLETVGEVWGEVHRK